MKAYYYLLLGALCCVLAGCSDVKPEAVSEARLYLQGDPMSLDPRIGFDRRTQQVLREMFEGLTRIGRNGEPQLALAESVRISPDGLTYTFRLRPSLWSNGLKVTADDFVFAWKSSLDPASSDGKSDALFAIANAKKARCGECALSAVGVRSLDTLTLEVTLDHPTPYFLELLANPVFSPLCRSVVEKDPNFAASSSYVSNGPFVLKERVLKSNIVLEKNLRYWNVEDVSLDRISFSIIEDSQTAYNMFCSGCLDWYGDPCGTIFPDIMVHLHRQGKLAVHHVGGSFQLLCRTTLPHLQSVNIRKALAYALNRQELCDSILQGGEVPALSLSPKTLSYAPAAFEDNNPEMARAFFAKGLQELQMTEETFPPLVFTFCSDPAIKTMMEGIQAQLMQVLPLKITLEPVDRGTYLRKVGKGEYDVMCLMLNVWVHDPSSNLDLFKSQKTVINGTGWSHPEYTRLLEQAASTVNADERKRCFTNAEALIMDQLPVIPVCYQTLKYVKSPQLVGEALSPVGIIELKWLKKRK
jgi:oligopeptide transport system substrate-binding protein